MTGFLQRIMGFQSGGVVKDRGVGLLVGEKYAECVMPPRQGEHVIAQTEDTSLGAWRHNNDKPDRKRRTDVLRLIGLLNLEHGHVHVKTIALAGIDIEPAMRRLMELNVAEYCLFDAETGMPTAVQIKEKNMNETESLRNQMTADMITKLAAEVHQNNVDSGWWMDTETGEDVRTWPKKFMDLWISAKLMLIVTEVAEAMEGHRKNLKDDKLPQYPMIRVELADAMIRILDMAGGFDNDTFPFGEVVMAKRAFNGKRADHKLENRRAAGGKSI